jgi:erythronate-4-phosphate dehydrogenase
MKIVADANIPFAEQAFSQFGNVRVASGLEIDKALVREADILLVRSVTRVDRKLLENSSVRFVGTATIGTDHVDTGYLAKRGTAFASAPGSNARSVAEYVACALVHVFKGDLAELSGKTLGVIGAGNVGSRVLAIARSFGMRCLVNDPPLEQSTGGKGFVSLDEITGEADIVTFHVPLTHSGEYPTVSMADETFIEKMKPSSMLINTSRGRVVNETALRSLRSRLGAVVLDVWENEPSINFKMLLQADIATPHIAGHSYDGKLRGAQMLFNAVAAFLKSEVTWNEAVFEPEATEKLIDVSEAPRPLVQGLESAYPIMEDDARLRKIVEQNDPGAYFEGLRMNYPKRFEFEHFLVRCSERQENTYGQVFRDLGFKVRMGRY